MQLWYIYGNCFWSQTTANIPIVSNVAACYTVFVVSKDALVEKDQMIKEMNVLTQQNQVLQESVDALQKDQAEKNNVSTLWQQGAKRTVANKQRLVTNYNSVLATFLQATMIKKKLKTVYIQEQKWIINTGKRHGSLEKEIWELWFGLNVHAWVTGVFLRDKYWFSYC